MVVTKFRKGHEADSGGSSPVSSSVNSLFAKQLRDFVRGEVACKPEIAKAFCTPRFSTTPGFLRDRVLIFASRLAIRS
jgi:hypothetical protein